MSSLMSQLPLDLGDGLILRFATSEDAEALAEFHHGVFDEPEGISLVGQWVRCLMSGKHPTFQPGDFALVEDGRSGRIVSSMCLISQTWTYGGVPFGFGQPEIVATDPEFQRRGLIRRQFELIHELSASRGELMLGITGIPWFYRQFGYEMAMNLGGERVIRREALSDAPDPPACRLRPFRREDAPFVTNLYETAIQRQVFASIRSPEHWTYEFASGRDRGQAAREWHVIENPDGERLGYLMNGAWMEDPWLWIDQLEVVSGVSYLNLLPSLLHALLSHADEMFASGVHPIERVNGLRLALGVEHPSYAAVSDKIAHVRPSYAWYIRVPDVAAFVWHVRAALERNLIGTVAEGYTGEIRLSFYRHGLTLRFDRGALVEVHGGPAPDKRTASFPDQTFLQLLCGRRRCADLRDAFPDCSVPHEAAAVLDALFPPFNGNVWHVM